MNLLKITLLSSSLFFFACSNEKPQDNMDTVPTTQPIETSEAQTQNPQVQTERNMDQPAVYTQDTGAINPPHGQPGHDCAVPVGAPLPGNNMNNNTNNPGASEFLTPTAAPDGVTLNPPHGQPGHDCAVPVGAPLY